MPISDYSISAASNTTINGVNVAEGCPPSSLNDGIRQLMADVRFEQALGTLTASSTVNIGAAAGYVHILPGTEITSFGTVAAGTERTLIFDGSITVSHSVNIVLPGSSRVVARSGDTMIVRSEGGGVWKSVSYGRGDGTGRTLLDTQTASSSATLDFTSRITSAFTDYELRLENLLAATDQVSLLLRTSTDNGSNWQASSFQHLRILQSSAAPSTLTGAGSASDSGIVIANNLSSTASRPISGTIRFSSSDNMFQWHVSYIAGTDDSSLVYTTGSGWISTGGINAVRLLMSSGNIASGTAKLYGIR